MTYRDTAYGDYHHHLSQHRTATDYDLHRRYLVANYLPLLPQDKAARIADVGCGRGHCLQFLREHGYTDAIGFDLCPANVEAARGRGLEAECRDAFAALASHPCSYEVVLMTDVLEHMRKEEILDVLRVVRDSLRPGGSLILRVPNMADPISGLRMRYNDFTHEIGFTEVSLRQVLGLAGLEVDAILPSNVYVLRNPILNLGGRTAAGVIHGLLRLLFLLQGVPSHILTKNIIGVAHKGSIQDAST